MNPFSSLKIEKIEGSEGGRQLFKLLSPLEFRLQMDGAGITVRVPAEFITDGASAPWGLWNVFPPMGPYCEIAALHDFLCRLPGCSRFLADAILREAMYRRGMPLWRRVVMYWAVRIYAILFVHKKPEVCDGSES